MHKKQFTNSDMLQISITKIQKNLLFSICSAVTFFVLFSNVYSPFVCVQPLVFAGLHRESQKTLNLLFSLIICVFKYKAYWLASFRFFLYTGCPFNCANFETLMNRNIDLVTFIQ